MVICVKLIKKDNISITKEEIIKNMNIIDNLLKDDLLKDDLLIDIKNNNYLIILCIIILILLIFIIYIKYFLNK